MLLSICIPYYKRINNIEKLLKSICKAKSREFEIIILDNCSSDNVDSFCKNDNRIKYHKREEKVPAFLNGFESMLLAKGQYCLICLDKDFINGDCLDNFIETLEAKRKIITCGYCALNDNNNRVIVNSNSRNKKYYSCRHPSGVFIRREIIEQENILKKIQNKNKLYCDNPFSTDILYSKALSLGSELVYDKKLFFTESLQEASKTMSYTYNKSNLFFMPKNKDKMFMIFLEHLYTLKLTNYEKKRIAIEMFINNITNTTIGYRNIMNNKYICRHYGIECENISVRELVTNFKNSSKVFIKEKITGIININKIFILLFASIKIIIKYYLYKQ